MSLIRLLTTTRSLSDVKNEPSPYRMSQQGLLPKFGPKKQREAPAGQTAREDDTAGGDARPSDAQEAVRRKASPFRKENLGEGTGDRTDAGCSLKLESSRKTQGNAERGTRSVESGWLRGWWQKLFRRRPRGERCEPVQGEFGLDLVRVVRNDLSEAEETRNAATNAARNKEKTLTAEEKTEAESVFGVTRG